MSVVKAKYRVFWTTTETDLESQLNALSGQGYSLAFWDYRHPSKDGDTDVYHAVMKLDGNGYGDVKHLRDVPPEEVDRHISEGWEICSTSLSVKFVRMVRRRVEKDETQYGTSLPKF